MAWILQTNPTRFDIDSYLTQYPFVYWSAPRHQGEFSVGDRAFLWRSGDTAGVVAVGRIRELPTAHSSVARPEALADDLWIDDVADPSEVKVGIDIDEVRLSPATGMLERLALKTHPQFRNARIIRIPQGTVFPLTSEECALLEELWNPGASTAQRNPAWERDELILALDLYFRLDRKIPNEDHPEVMSLSELLNDLPIHSDRPDAVRFRNANGVVLKLANFRAFDQPGHGMSRGGKLDKVIWKEFVDDRDRLSRLAEAIRAGYHSGETSKPAEDQDELEFPEGRIAFRLHRSRERSAALVRQKKKAVLDTTGALKCEVCGFSFSETYGYLGEGYIECHHVQPVSELKPGATTRLSDVVVVCSNCHRMLHRRRPWLTAAEMRVLVARDSQTA